MVSICKNFSLRKIMGDLVYDSVYGKFGLVYFDAFGPEKQPEMWTKDIFRKISGITLQNGVLVTYSSKGDVKRNLRESGFKVSLLPGPPGKRHIIRAVKL
jgi:tRNA U34 5-methylaminomethyl-2-thiouridine-forming methyltransferase MnmC